jgi:hypothetical protein
MASFLPGQRERRWGALSCPYSEQGVARCDPWSTDYWNPPTTPSQHAPQRILALIVAIVLAALLAPAGW